ncbi:MAG: proline racemase family protein [Pseudonocardia sp.]
MDPGLDPARTTVPELVGFFEALFTQIVPDTPLTLGLLAGPMRRNADGEATVDVAVYMDGGVICRGPTGTGTTALLAWLHQRGHVDTGTTVRVVSPYRHEFTGTMTGSVTTGRSVGVRTRITGVPHLLARSQTIVDFEDPLIDDHGLSGILSRPGT